jgi:hypothetical protein
MAQVARSLVDVRVGDQIAKVVTIVEKVETPAGWLLTYSDGSSESFDSEGGPAIYVEAED